MDDTGPTYDDLLTELETLRARVAYLEYVEAERSLAEHHLQWQLALNEALSALSRPLIAGNSSLPEIAGTILVQAHRLTGCAYGFVSTIDAATGDLINHTMTQGLADRCGVPMTETHRAFARGADGGYPGLWGCALNTGQGFYTNHPAAHPAFVSLPREHLPLEQFLAVPVMLGEEIVGLIALANPGRDYTGRDLEAVSRLAEFYALAIQRRRTEDEREELIEDLNAYGHTVAHDLKNPLGVVISAIDLLSADCTDLNDEVCRQYLQIAAHSSAKMYSIIDDLLLLASVRSREVSITVQDMGEIVPEALLHLSLMIEESGAEIMLPESWPPALGYAPWIEHLWVNYVSNAIKYGGTPPRVEIGATELPDRMVRFWVRDNGPGISPDLQAQLFKPFMRLNGVRVPGYGLGLSIVQRITEKLGGTVSVMSTPGHGSTFSFTLPAPHD